MSTQPEKPKKIPRRRLESILAEVILCKKLGWDIGFLSGGHGAYQKVEFENLLKHVYLVWGRKFWVNVGEIEFEELKRYKNYIKGVAAAVETVNQKVHDFACPSKPLRPIEEMLDHATQLGLEKSMTIIIGLGETIKDYPKLNAFIKKHGITRIHFYSLNPQEGTYYENKKSPSKEYLARWITKTRKDFPEIEIHAGIWKNKLDHIPLLLDSGATALTKYPAVKYFGTDNAKEFEDMIYKAGLELKGTMTELPKFDIDKEVNGLKIEDELKLKIKKKLESYLKTMRKNIEKRIKK